MKKIFASSHVILLPVILVSSFFEDIKSMRFHCSDTLLIINENKIFLLPFIWKWALSESLFLSVTFSSDWFTCKFQTLESSHHRRDWVFCSTCRSSCSLARHILLAQKFNNHVDFFLSLSMSNSINQCLFSQKAYICFSSFLLQVARSLSHSFFFSFQLTNILWCVNVKKTRINNICNIPQFDWMSTISQLGVYREREKDKTILLLVVFFFRTQ